VSLESDVAEILAKVRALWDVGDRMGWFGPRVLDGDGSKPALPPDPHTPATTPGEPATSGLSAFQVGMLGGLPTQATGNEGSAGTPQPQVSAGVDFPANLPGKGIVEWFNDGEHKTFSVERGGYVKGAVGEATSPSIQGSHIRIWFTIGGAEVGPDFEGTLMQVQETTLFLADRDCTLHVMVSGKSGWAMIRAIRE
jgi:hypothetical protein